MKLLCVFPLYNQPGWVRFTNMTVYYYLKQKMSTLYFHNGMVMYLYIQYYYIVKKRNILKISLKRNPYLILPIQSCIVLFLFQFPRLTCCSKIAVIINCEPVYWNNLLHRLQVKKLTDSTGIKQSRLVLAKAKSSVISFTINNFSSKKSQRKN